MQDIKTAGPQSQVLSGVVMDRSLVQVSAQNGSAVSGWGLCDRLLQVTLKLGEDDYEVSVLGTQFPLFRVFVVRSNRPLFLEL